MITLAILIAIFAAISAGFYFGLAAWHYQSAEYEACEHRISQSSAAGLACLVSVALVLWGINT